MSHVSQRLSERGIDMSESFLQALARNIKTSAAIILRTGENNKSADGSNGENVILIAREGKAVTAMFRRSNQPMTREALRVDEVRKL